MTVITEKAWEKVGKKHHHGINIPLASIWTEKSCGIGEFLDLLPMIDLCVSVNFDVLQLLPLNDSGLDHSPYNALSSTALNPIHLSLHGLPNIPKDLKQELKTFRSFNEPKHILYPRVRNEKSKWLKRYVKTLDLEGNQEFQEFKNQSEWLQDYALFKVLKEKNHNAIWLNWDESEKNLSTQARKKLCQTYASEIEHHTIVQYLCYHQLKQVKAYAEKNHVFLKGDIPILVSPDSVDVWAHQEFFDLTLVAGSPPNKFDPKGQVWNFPLYNWKAMEANHFEWWRKRVKAAAEYFHIYRIDHILGFFRIWAIPHKESPDKGHFEPSDEGLMEAQGRLLLKTLVSFSDMLPIGEDLGDPPSFVREVMNEYGIPGTKIFRRYRSWKTDRSFIPIDKYLPCSLSCVSTHDIETVYLWWENYPDEAADYAAFKGWPYSPKLNSDQHRQILRDCHQSNSLFHINLLQEYLALIPSLTWEDPSDERINFPGTESMRNWAYRYKFPVTTLLKSEALKTLFKSLIS